MPYKDRRTGQWIGQVKETLPNGKVKKHCARLPKLGMAKAWEREKQKEIDEQFTKGMSTDSLIDWANAYLSFSKKKHVKKTYEEKRLAFKLLLKAIDPAYPLKMLQPRHFLSHLETQMEGRSGNAANKDRKNLVAAWNWGIQFAGMPEKNPIIKVPRFATEKDERRVPTMDEFWKVYKATTTEQDKHMLFCYLHTGARRDELFRLMWKDVDFDKKLIRLYTRKNKSGQWKNAWLPISDELLIMLRKQRMVTGLLGNVFMWRTEDGQWLPYLYRQHWMKRLCKRAKVEKFGFHGIRHLFASILAAKGVVLVEIQRMLRHESINTTARYIHSLNPEGREVVGVLPRLEDQKRVAEGEV
ncbi:site-specific integrase [Desulfobulbus rhabdoformis]|uniref:tyrosine-type recombinase/integrase n=1 Tax=Desulfobulbus rhabdoformis TaxID=34032 RepID=UPI0019655A4D|nr:site-specific integrase [Desulfobulbus rhabdoformis]MBM9615263.1 site-specific integrase [Desulfobulbus rhabdoformis]